MALTDTAIRNAKPKDKAFKLGDAGGLFLLVTPAGGKLWRVKFRVAGKEKLLSLGGWPDVSLANARKERDKAREALAGGADPAREKQLAKHQSKVSAGNTFGEVAQEFIDKRRREGLSESTAEKSEYYVSRMGTAIARLPIAEITAPEVLAVLRRVEATGNYETARRVLQLAGRVFRDAVATARLASDPIGHDQCPAWAFLDIETTRWRRDRDNADIANFAACCFRAKSVRSFRTEASQPGNPARQDFGHGVGVRKYRRGVVAKR